MATYVYEIIPQTPGEAPRRFEVVQSMKDAPLTRHPGTGEAVKRVISGGFGYMSAGGKNPLSTATPPTPCAAGCACHSESRFPQP